MQAIRDLLESPDWVIIVFFVVYTIILILLTWKFSSWYRNIAGWNKRRANEKDWKEKVSRLESEIDELKNQPDRSSSSDT